LKKTSLIIKRTLDIVLAGVLLVILAVPLAAIALLVLLDSGRPVLFVQERAGLNGRPFKIYKFRAMVQNAEKIGLGVFTEENDPRITRVGRWLRKWSLDELPQLFNILKGDMSFVGPRPTLMYQVEKYDERQRKRLLVKPGVTGWAQVNGRNSLTWPERIELDVWYVEHWSLWLDLYILFVRTPLIVLRRAGIYGQPVDEISRVSERTNGAGQGVSKDRTPDFYRTADICLVPLKDVPLFKTFIPSKIFCDHGLAAADCSSPEGRSGGYTREVWWGSYCSPGGSRFHG